MKIKIVKIIIVITIIICWAGRAEPVEAVIKKAGNIEVITDEPLFSDSIIWYPGLAVEKSFQVKNRGGGGKTAQIETENETETKQLAKILTVQINEGSRGIYGVSEGKTLRNFFDSSGITLGEIFGDDSGKVFSVAVTMPVSAGNEYQGARAKFDLRIGFLGASESSVTVTGESSGVLGESGRSGKIEGGEGGRQNPEEEGGGEEEGQGSGGLEGGGQSPGEVAGAGTEGINWGFLAMIGGFLASGGLAAWMRLRLRGK